MKDIRALLGLKACAAGLLGLWVANKSSVESDGVNLMISPWIAKLLGMFSSNETIEMSWVAGHGLTEERAIVFIACFSALLALFSIAMSYLSFWHKENEKLSIAALFLGNMLVMLLNLYIGLSLLAVTCLGAIWLRSSIKRILAKTQ